MPHPRGTATSALDLEFTRPFTVVEVAHGLSLDYLAAHDVPSQHYAFLVPDEAFQPIIDRLADRGVPTWADPWHGRSGENGDDGGRGAYFDSPEGHNLEILTRPYGSGT